MHLRTRGKAPEKLATYQQQYTQGWVDYYRHQKGTKPTDHYWTNPAVRAPLIEVFLDNCAYCGVGLGVHPSKCNPNVKIPIGEIDHFLPKSKRPGLVYHWRNLVWACKDCNKAKQDYYNTANYLLDPCKKKDMQILEMRMDGKYYLKSQYEHDPALQDRYAATCENTLINSGCHPQQRRDRKAELEDAIDDLIQYHERIQAPNAYSPALRQELRKQYDKAKKTVTRAIHSSSYKSMIKHIIQERRQQDKTFEVIFHGEITAESTS